jgi:hypothetical protein
MTGTVAATGTGAYWAALQDSVCAICLDRRDDGSCGLPHDRVCALKTHLALVVDVVHRVESPRMDEYVAAVDGTVCRVCPEQHGGECGKREAGECALYTYLPLVVDAVEAADESIPRP